MRRVLSYEFDGCDGWCDRELPCMACRYRASVDDSIISDALLELRARYAARATRSRSEEQ